MQPARATHRADPSQAARGDEVSAALHEHVARSSRWLDASFGEQARALEASLDTTAAAADAWARRGHQAKGLPEDAAEEWLTGPIPVLRGLRLWARSLRRLAEGRPPLDPERCTSTPDGRVAVRTFPTDAFDAAMFRAYEAHAHLRPGLSVAEAVDRSGAAARARRGGCCVILGAGNVSAIPALDALTKCVNEQVPSIVKLSPVNAWARPFLERALAPLVELGAVAFVEGDAETGAQLLAAEPVTEVHLTGSHGTFERLRWGSEDPEARKREGRPALDKPISSELGNVSPVLIVPGNYAEAELDHLVGETVAMLTNNASFNCAAGKVVVLAEGWHQKEPFVRRLVAALRRVPTRRAYYPGARDRWAALTADRTAQRIGLETADRLPWTLIRGLDPDGDEPLFRTEAFCPVLGFVELDVPDAVAFVERAARFANERLWGTLNACWFVSRGQSALQPVRSALDRATAELRYGTVAINCWPALSFGLVSTAWGGHPSSSEVDVQSGQGFVHDTFMLEGVEKTVLRSPMPAFPKPVWFADHGHARDVGRRMVQMERRPSWLRVPGLAFSALLG